MYNKNLDHEILKLIEAQPEISEKDIACTLSVPEELVKTRIANFKDTRQKILIMGYGNNISNIKMTLEAEDYNVVKVNVVKAPGGFSALEVVKSEKPDLVLLDTGLADIEGFKICRQLKASSRYWWIPVMMLSESDGVKNRVEAFESGADDYVSTPFNPLELRARVGMILRRTRI
jgi:two-component system, OmpR family, alkaline phosphatase synthesis response regulator PhoP